MLLAIFLVESTTMPCRRGWWEYADQASAAYATTYASVNTWARCVNVFGNTCDQFAYARYTFTLPSASVYGTLTFAAIGRVNLAGPTYGPAVLGIWNWNTAEVDGLAQTGLSYAWYSTAASGGAHVSSTRKLWAVVTAFGALEGNWDIRKVKLTYRYALLR